MIRITSISGQVFFQPEKKAHLKVEKVQPIEGPVFQKRNYSNPDQGEKKQNKNESNDTFESVLKRELDKKI